MALDPGVEKIVWERNEWGKRKTVQTGPYPVRMGLAVKTLEFMPFVQIVDLRPKTIFEIWPEMNGDKKRFVVKVIKAYGEKKRKYRRNYGVDE